MPLETYPVVNESKALLLENKARPISVHREPRCLVHIKFCSKLCCTQLYRIDLQQLSIHKSNTAISAFKNIDVISLVKFNLRVTNSGSRTLK